MDYPSNDPLSGLYWIAAEIQRAVTPAPLTIAALLDPFNMAAGASSTSSTTDPSVEAYAMQLRVVQGVLFGMAVLVLAGSIIFAIGRIAFNSCGGLESTKESGYRAATMWTTRVFFYVFGFVLLAMCALSLYANVTMGQGIALASSIFTATLPPLTGIQVAHMQQVITGNEEMFDFVQNSLTGNFSTIWNTTMQQGINEALNATSVNVTAEAVLIADTLASIQTAVDTMRADRQAVFQDLTIVAENINARPQSSADVRALVNETVLALQKYYNFTTLDRAMGMVNLTLASSVPAADRTRGAGALAHTLPATFEPANLIALMNEYYAAVGVNLQNLYSDVKFGVRRCMTGVQTQQAVPVDGLGFVKFTSLMEMLDVVAQYGLPTLYAVTAVMALSALGGGIAWTTQSYTTFYWTASFFIIGMISTWGLMGFLMPTSIITTDACTNGTYFAPNSIPISMNALLANTSGALNAPTCEACERNPVTVGWRNFERVAMAELEPVMNVNAALSVEGSTDGAVPGPMFVLQALQQLAVQAESVDVARPSGRDRAWSNPLSELRDGASPNDTALIKDLETLERIGDSLVTRTESLVQDFYALQTNVSTLVDPINSMNESLSTAADDQLLASATSAISQMDTVLTSLRNNYQQVNADMEVQCLSVANKTAVSTEQYADFEKAMCGDTAVGLGSSWFIQFIMFFALIPVVVLSLKAFKVISYAVLIDDDLLPAF